MTSLPPLQVHLDLRASVSRWLGAALLVLLAALAAPGATAAQSAPEWPPATLRDTGLYSDWATKTVAADNLPFSPQYPLWSDGAEKSRWLRIPKGTFIDGSNPDVWRFPVGTRVWKEFRFGRRAETRFIELTRAGWQFASYVWNEDETEAPLAPEMGISQSILIRDGIRHRIPSRIDCRACHEAGPVRLLGLTTLQLSSDRDPNAPHAEPVPPGAVDLPALVARGLVRGLPPAITRTPPRIVAPTPTARAALGYLNANCGGCHTSLGDLSSLSFALNYPVGRPVGEPAPALLTAVGRPSRFKVPAAPEDIERICAGHPERSVLVARMSSRHPLVQMPPLGTRIADDEAVSLISRWISDDVGSPEPAAKVTEAAMSRSMMRRSAAGFATMTAAVGLIGWAAGSTRMAAQVSQDAAAKLIAAKSAGVSEGSAAQGKYLVTAIACHDCHTPAKMGPNGPEPDMARMLSGHPATITLPPPPAVSDPWMASVTTTFTAWAGPWGISYAANLTPDMDTGIGAWTEQQFVETIRSGRHQGRGRELLPPMPWQMYRNLNDADLKSIFAYLKTIPAISNKVPDPVIATPPSK